MKTIIETGLSLTGTKKLGNVLLEEAAKANKEQLQKRVITNIADLLKQVDVQRKALGFLESMIEALKGGEFTLSQNGQIQFNNEELNHDARWISNCSQCGYDKIVIAPARGAR